MTFLLQDLRYALRHLTRYPSFTAIAILTLALGIGANTAIFSVVHGVLLKPLGYPEPQNLMLITSQFPAQGFDQFWVSPPEYLEFQERNRSFAEVGAYVTRAANLSDSTEPLRVQGAAASAELFSALDVPAQLGRVFAKDDDVPGAEPVMVMSHELWQRAYGGDPDLVGRSLELGGAATTVIGIMPPGFDVHDQGIEVWRPLGLDPANPGGRGSHYLYLIGRLDDGVGLAQARADLETLLAGWSETNPGEHVPHPERHRLQIEPLLDDVVGDVRPALFMLLGAVGFVLLIACANVANLLLVKAEGRQKEIAIRTAIGAGRWRLLRQFLTEGLVLSLVGGALGLLLAYWGTRLLLAVHPESLPRSGEVGLDPWVLGFTALVTVATGLFFGLAPAFHLSVKSLSDALREGDQRTTAARHHVRRTLVVAELALAVILVVLCGLMLRSLWNLLGVDTGFDPSRVVTFQLSVPSAKVEDPAAVVSFYERLVARLEALPGVESAAAMNGLPPKRSVNANDTEFEGLEPTKDGPPHNTDYWQFVTPDYFATLGVELVDGEPISERHDAAATPVVLINETAARTFWPDENPLGKRLRPGWGDSPWRTIIGIVADVKQGGIEAETGTELYFPYAQAPTSMPYTPRTMHLAVRSAMPLPALATSLRSEVRALDASLPIADLRSMDAVVESSLARPRFLAWLLGIFAFLALALAAIGTYGVLAFAVAQRRREIGIRMALGAEARNVLTLVLGQGMRLAVVGLVLGIVGAYFLTRLAASLFFQVAPSDPLTFGGVLLLLAVVAFLACWLPARRATRVDPITVLRHE